MAKVVGRYGKKAVAQVVHGRIMRTNIPAGMASPSPPLGPMLGQRQINIANFCKEFNQKTEKMKKGVPLPVIIKTNPDRTYELIIHKPPATFFLKQAAGIEKGKMWKGEVAGKITFKHLYEIAVVKSEDYYLQLESIENICKMFISIARTCGIEIVRDLDESTYAAFLEERQKNVQEYIDQLQAEKVTKLLRT